MGWYFKRITIPANTTRPNYHVSKMNFVSGELKGVMILLPATSSAWQAGVRIKTASLAILPAMTEGGDAWLRSQTEEVHQIFETNWHLAEVSPNQIIIESINTTDNDIKIQVGFRFVTVQDQDTMALKNILHTIQAMGRVSQMPDIEKQIRRVGDLIVKSLRISKDKDQG